MARTLVGEEASIHKVLSTKVGLEETATVKSVGMVLGHMRYSVKNPVVYKVKGTDSILVLGDLESPIDLRMFEKMYRDNLAGGDAPETGGLYDEVRDNTSEDGSQQPEASAPAETGCSGVSEDDIRLISSQVDASREDIIKALVDSDHDVVNAMMKLTK